MLLMVGDIIIAVFVAGNAWQNEPALLNLFSPAQLMNASFNRWGLGNAYGAFGSMTETRDEIIIEGWIAPDEGGSGEGDPDESSPGEDGGTAGGAAGWREYRCKGKPGDVERIRSEERRGGKRGGGGVVTDGSE